MCWLRILPFALLVVFSALVIGGASADEHGKFRGRVLAEWLEDGRKMRLEEAFEFIGPNARSWLVPKGAVIDGASIPQVFWSIVGGPLEDRYRKASVVHDFYCDTRNRRWQDVHQMFYHAMRASGVDHRKAWLLYQAVQRFGPRWQEPAANPSCIGPHGKIDFERCVENTEGPTPEIQWPSLTKDELLKFVREMEKTAHPGDLRKLRDLAKRSPSTSR